MNEAIMNFMNKDITSEKGQAFSLQIMDYLRDKMSDVQEETGNLYNLEATPAESTAYRLALKDRKLYPEIMAQGTEETPYYTNSSQLPADYTSDIFEVLDLQDELQSKYTGGTVLHLYTADKIEDKAAVSTLISRIFKRYELPYVSYTPTFSHCSNHGYFKGELWECPECAQPLDVYSRVVGYYRPVQRYNKGKVQEFEDRIKFEIDSHLA
jgi:ribonucleoside-triphosphate reductase